MKTLAYARRKGERGQTIIIVAAAMVALLGMAALAIDVTVLYVARAEAQRAADAAALAGAQIFATSSFATVPGSFGVPSEICASGGPGSSAAANKVAEAVVAQNLVSNQVATITNVNCILVNGDPQVTVTLQRNGLPTFFSRIWGAASPSVTVKATAEAYNASGSSTVPVEVRGAKPWLLANCDPISVTGTINPNCNTPYFVNPGGTLANGGSFIGETIPLARLTSASTPGPNGLTDGFYALDFGTPATTCPSFGGVCVQDGAYRDDIQCSSPVRLSCGQMIGGAGIPIIGDPTPASDTKTRQATRCLIHAASNNAISGQDKFSTTGVPVNIAVGDNNPNSSLPLDANVSRSDSVVTVPLFNFNGVTLCPGGACTGTTTIVGFMQLGITLTCNGSCPVPSGIAPPPTAIKDVQAVILNAVGCSASGSGVSGGEGGSPMAVRLIHL